MALAALFVLASPPALNAQVPGIGIDLVPRVGRYLPVQDTREVPAGVGEIGQDESSAFGLGLSAEVELPVLAPNIRGTLMYGSGSQIFAENPDGQTETAGSSVLAATADLVFSPLPSVILVQPHLIAGGGYKRVGFDTGDFSPSLGGTFPESDRTFTFHWGAGVDLSLPGTVISVELSDFASGLFSGEEVQHDLFLTAGLGFSIL